MKSSYLVHVVVGARPNFVKAAPVLSALKSFPHIRTKLIHSGQHYDYIMSKSFFDIFCIPEPDFNMGIGSDSQGRQTGRMLIGFEKLFMASSPDLILVLGDVNSTLAAALAAVKLSIPVAHVESGLRSFDRAMPEEINRILTDHISSVHFATEKAAVLNLSIEGISGSNVHLVGNVMIDALLSISDKISASRIRQKLSIERSPYSVVTLHRPSNVDSKEGLETCLRAIASATSYGQVIFPMHPRTAGSLLLNNYRDIFHRIPNLTIIEPLGYADFINLVQSSVFIMTDSGGIQSEASYLKVPCITLRDSTEHLITIEKGTNSLTGMDPSNIDKAISRAISFRREKYEIPDELDGKASQRIAEAVSCALLSGTQNQME